MANELVQGLLQGLLQPQQGPNPADLMTAISSRNPMAAVSAMQAPQLSQMFGQQFRGLVGGLTGKPAPQTANEAFASSLQQMAAQPDLMNSSVGLAKMAQAASTVGRTAEAMQFSLMASQKKQEEEQLARQTTQQGLGVATSVNAITETIKSLDPQKDAKQISELLSFRDQVASGVIQPEAVQPALTAIGDRNKQDTLTANQMANLYGKFTPESIAAYRANPSAPLVPLPKVQEQQTLSPNTLATLYRDYTPESVQAYIKDQNAVLVRMPQSYQELSPTQQVETLQTSLSRVPTFNQTSENISQLNQVKNLLPLLDSNNPQAFTVISQVIPQLVGSNSRAQAEIDAFRSRKGIKESIGDWFSLLGGGTATAETKQNIQEIINILDSNFTAQRMQEVSSAASPYSSILPEQRILDWQQNVLNELVSDDVENIVNSALGI